MKKQLLVYILILLPEICFAQKKYELFQFGDTSQYHLRPGFVNTTPPGVWLFGSGCYCDSSRMDTIYNMRRFSVLSNVRDTSAEVLINRDTIIQDGKRLAFITSKTGNWYVYLPGNTLIATFTIANDNNCSVRTMLDMKTHELFLTGFYERQVAEYLIKNGYL